MFKRLILYFLISLIGKSVFCQLAFDRISVGRGLSQSTVLSIAKDRRGYMWFGTVDKLNRYNGREFKIYHTDTGKFSISSDDYIQDIAEDKKGNLWIGTQKGLNRYVPELDRFERILPDKKNSNSISDASILTIAAGKGGRIWFGTNNGLSMLSSSDSRKLKKFYKNDGLASNIITAVCEDSKGRVWVGTQDGLTVMTPESGSYRLTTFRNSVNNSNSISGNVIKSIAEDKKGRIWIGTETDGLNLFLSEHASFIRFRHNPGVSGGLSNNKIRKIFCGTDGRLWIGTMNGLNIIDPDRLFFTVYKNEAGDPKSLSNNSIKDIYEDEHGSIWIGTMFGGISVIHPSSGSFNTYRYNKYGNTISSDIICAINGDQNDNIWVGTEGYGLNYLDVKTDRFKYYRNDPLDPGSLGSNTIKAIYRDRKGQIWIGLYENGLELFNPKTDNFIHYRPDAKNPNAISQGYISCITEDKDGFLWCGTASMGINRFDPRNQTFMKYTDASTSPLRLNNNYISAIFVDTRGNLWVGTAEGINFLPAGGQRFSYLLATTLQDHVVTPNIINCIQEDRAGNIWIGSYRGGLNMFNPKTKTFTAYTNRNGLISNNVIDIRQDKEGFLWLSTDKGLTKFDPAKKNFKSYGILDGLPANQFNSNSAYKDSKGRLYFGSFGGLVAFTPKDIRENTKIPTVVFSGLKLFNQEVSINGPDKLLQNDISVTGEIVFSADQNIFSVEFAALNYVKPERNRYAYKLEGFEKNWNFVTSPSASYTNLPDGTYTLLIKGSNNDGYWNPNPARLTIRILPPLWRTWWAYIGYAVVMLFILYHINRLLNKQSRLKTDLFYEQLNNERQQELFQMKLDFITRISHEFRTPLTLIYSPLERLIDLTSASKEINMQLVNMKTNTDRLLRLISELLDFRKMETGSLHLNVQKLDIVKFSRDVFEVFSSQAEIQSISYIFETNVLSAFIYFDPVQMEKVLFNLLSNAFKYTPSGRQINFYIKLNNDNVDLIITDKGSGIAFWDQDKVFNNFYRAEGQSSQQSGWGIGLALVKDLVRMHRGGIELYSVPASGDSAGITRFTISLLKGNSHFSPEELFEEKSDTIDSQLTGEPSDLEIIAPLKELGKAKLEKAYVVMVVEDNADLRNFIVTALEDIYTVLTCVDGNEGWETAIEQIPDLMISDVTMPGMNGYELCIKLKTEERTNHIPVIMLTAMASQLHQINGMEAGADVYLTKPFSMQFLQLNIRNLLHSRERLKEMYAKQVTLMPRKLNIESPDEKFLNKLMVIVEDNMEDAEFNVITLVDEIGMSQTVLYKKIKALTGLSIGDFIKSMRLKRAAQLLEDGKLKISEIAYITGFNSRKYFSQEFRKQFGKSPSEYGGEKTARA